MNRREILIMCRKIGVLSLFLLIVIGLTACSDDRPLTTEKAPDTSETKEVKPKEKLIEPDAVKIQEMAENIIENIHKVMKQRANSRDDWLMVEEMKETIIEEEIEKSLKPLSKYVAVDSAEKYADEFLEALTCHCDSFLLFSERDVKAGFTVTNYTKDTIEAESITVNEVGLYETGWKSYWTFTKENGLWKLLEHEFTFPDYDSDPLDVTFEDIEYSFFEYGSEHEGYTDKVIPVQFVEYIEVEGERFLVIQMPDRENTGDSQASTAYVVYNTELGIEDPELTEEYNSLY